MKDMQISNKQKYITHLMQATIQLFASYIFTDLLITFLGYIR